MSTIYRSRVIVRLSYLIYTCVHIVVVRAGGHLSVFMALPHVVQVVTLVPSLATFHGWRHAVRVD